jgi:hypothetical protein
MDLSIFLILSGLLIVAGIGFRSLIRIGYEIRDELRKLNQRDGKSK